ncbi:unnamed protein product [Nesidiocoris tenuis]|uniref:Uncharacterized protein n=1 Tax=Nesidiocoris tenuis TaxID=355587 RepID=A0A6H5GE70_9HEMI|nr:unnamed protein product [Nesidiocoris tenuis]
MSVYVKRVVTQLPPSRHRMDNCHLPKPVTEKIPTEPVGTGSTTAGLIYLEIDNREECAH